MEWTGYSKDPIERETDAVEFLPRRAALAVGCALQWVALCSGLRFAMGCALQWVVLCSGLHFAMGCALQ